MNIRQFDSRRIKCPYCGSSDGFARVLDSATLQPLDDSSGKCHSCGVFKTPDAVGYESAQAEVISLPPFSLDKTSQPGFLRLEGLDPYASTLVGWAAAMIPNAAAYAEEMHVYGDAYCNTTFAYVDIEGRLTSTKTIRYGKDGHRDKTGLITASGQMTTSQVAGYINRNGVLTPNLTADGCYQLLYGQHQLAGKSKPIVIFESEKTAFVASLFQRDMYFLAAGGAKGFTPNKVNILRKCGVVPGNLVDAFRNNKVIICFDHDSAGEGGANLAKKAAMELGATDVVVENMRSLLTNSGCAMPESLRPSCDMADVISWAYSFGQMGDDIEPVFKRLYAIAGGEVNPAYEKARREYYSIGASDYTRPEPTPSLVFRDLALGTESQLAIPGNVVMILASAGIGKSSVVGSIVAKHLVPSADAFGLDINAPNGVLVVDTEQSRDQVVGMHRRIARRMNVDVMDMPRLFEHGNVQWLVTNKKLTAEEQAENLFAMVQATNPSFVVVDQIASLIADVNKPDVVTTFLRRIATDAEESLRTWVVVLHTNPTSDKARGTLGSELHRLCSSVMFLRKPAKEGEPSLLTTNHIDGTMPKVRAGAPVRCFFSWDAYRGDFYPTQASEMITVSPDVAAAALEEIFSGRNGPAQPIGMTELRKQLKDLLGNARDANSAFRYIFAENWVKRTFGGKLWPDYDRIRQAMPDSDLTNSH